MALRGAGITIGHLKVRSGKGRWETKTVIHAPDGGPDITILSGSIQGADKITDVGGDMEVNIFDTKIKRTSDEEPDDEPGES